MREKLEERQEHLEELEEEIEELEEELESAGDVKEVLDVVSERIPNLMRGIQETVYSPEQMKKSAEGVAVFYKTLVDAGMEKNIASAMTMEHLANLQRQLRAPRHAIRIPNVPEMPEMPEIPDIPDIVADAVDGVAKRLDATDFHFRAGRSDESSPTRDEEA